MAESRKVYIAGPISLGGRLSLAECEANIKEFDQAETEIRALGHEPMNPAAIERNGQKVAVGFEPWAEFMRAGLRLLLDCDAIWMLKGWELSPGARLEHSIAVELGMSVMGDE